MLAPNKQVHFCNVVNRVISGCGREPAIHMEMLLVFIEFEHGVPLPDRVPFHIANNAKPSLTPLPCK